MLVGPAGSAGWAGCAVAVVAQGGSQIEPQQVRAHRYPAGHWELEKQCSPGQETSCPHQGVPSVVVKQAHRGDIWEAGLHRVNLPQTPPAVQTFVGCCTRHTPFTHVALAPQQTVPQGARPSLQTQSPLLQCRAWEQQTPPQGGRPSLQTQAPLTHVRLAGQQVVPLQGSRLSGHRQTPLEQRVPDGQQVPPQGATPPEHRQVPVPALQVAPAGQQAPLQGARPSGQRQAPFWQVV
ncbi:MAG: hypothetical protein JOZ41_02030, partial [Chloroflexi bacterium]|nr:hypothetical protein [Chloroflexota bacterium]